MTQPSALAAITAALTAKQPTAGAAAPAVPQAFAFVPQAQGGPPPQQSTNPAPFAATPFQPTPVQAQAAFVAAVPFAGQLHAHPQTGVPFAPINPPGEATSAPTVGLDAAPAVLTQTVVAPEPAPKAARTRKRREHPATMAELLGIVATESAAGDGAGEPAAASALQSIDGDIAVANGRVTAHSFNTEDLVDALAERGWTITLSK
jgi:hypothetical protein